MINGLSGSMRGKITLISIMLILSMLIVPASTEANYPLGISGESSFVVPPFQAKLLNDTTTYFRLYLDDTAQSSLDIEVEVEGDIADYIIFPEYNGTLPTLTIYPGDNLKIPYMIDFPASTSGKYTGTILAIGTPPPSQITGTGAIGKPVMSINLLVDVPTDIQIYNFAVTNPDGFLDQQWNSWGTGWGTSFDVINGANETFNGYCNVTLSDATSVLEYDNYTITNLTALSGIDPHTTSWQTDLPLGAAYAISAKVYSTNNTGFDEETGSIAIPTPADIISVNHQPDIVFGDDVVTVYALLASSDSTVELHWQPAGGSETTAAMTYSSTHGEFIGNIPEQAADTTINYWVTSTNGAYSDRSPEAGAYSYYVFVPDISDLVIDENSISFTPIDPTATNMNESESGTNIFVTIRNTGPGDASDILVKIYDMEEEIFSITIPSLAGEGNSDTVNFNWAPTQGVHNLRFDVDPDNTIQELNENNNDYSISATIYAPDPSEGDEDDEPDDPVSDNLVFIIIPLIILLAVFLLLFLLKKGKKINVVVYKARPSRADKEGKMRWIYNCGYGDDIRLGNTTPTTVKATKGDIIQVDAQGLSERDDGRIVWQSAEAIKLQPKLDKADDPDKIKKMVAKKKSKK